MKIENRLLQKVGGLSLSVLTRMWMGTLDYRVFYYSQDSDPVQSAFQGEGIFLLWHEYIPFAFYLRGNCNIAMLVSRHQDAEWLSMAARHMGYRTVRGSTNRGGVAALRQLMRSRHRTSLTITPDGPRGPRRQLSPGAVYLASRLEMPIIVAGLGYDRPWRLRRTWDQFAVPRPFSRARMVLSPKIHVPAGLDRKDMEPYRLSVESTLNRLTDEAERWAETGVRVEGQVPLRRQPAPLPCPSRKAA